MAIRDSLTEFVRAVQSETRAGTFRGQIEVAQVGGGRLWFGCGYYSPDNVLWWPPAPDKAGGEELSVEDGVSRFLAGLEGDK